MEPCANVTSVTLQMTEEEFIEDKLRNALQYDPSMSLFDKHKSQTIEQCAPHARTHVHACGCSHTAAAGIFNTWRRNSGFSYRTWTL